MQHEMSWFSLLTSITENAWMAFSNAVQKLAMLFLMGSTVMAPQAGEVYNFVNQPTHTDLRMGDTVWLRTMIEPLDEDRREETYKPYTHIFDFAGSVPITKGPGGTYPHHRGMYIGWNKTIVGDPEAGESYDTWHMSNSYQQHTRWVRQETTAADKATQVQEVFWNTNDGDILIREVRTISARKGNGNLRIFDFGSNLTAEKGDIQFRGDSHHGGMQVRLEEEVVTNQEGTEYILPEGSKRLDNDEVEGAWWIGCSAEVGGKRYWFVHMTPKDYLPSPPTYSIRGYARFGSYFEFDLSRGDSKQMDFRIAVSDSELTPQQMQDLYEQYLQER